VGLGDSGAACVRWLVEHDARVRGTDTRAAPPHAVHLAEAFPEATLTLGGFVTADFDWADLIVVSPGVAVATAEIQAAKGPARTSSAMSNCSPEPSPAAAPRSSPLPDRTARAP